ncbi:hypothetical protein evm_014386 [Chilo suppressalis]|nr:hypothetical protein evm_014386 [Chilo suppressalis]
MKATGRNNKLAPSIQNLTMTIRLRSCQSSGLGIGFGYIKTKDGTAIKFNKDADKINAESKKKVELLSEELLPYIIAEQDRRTTLYKRIMSAIQNGERGVTIAEIRNRPPLIIRKEFSNSAMARALYNAYVQSKLEYWAVLWDPHEKKYGGEVTKDIRPVRWLYKKCNGIIRFFVPFPLSPHRSCTV